jgi:hypothetical protein
MKDENRNGYRRNYWGFGKRRRTEAVLPIEEALQDFNGQRFTGGEDGAECGAHVFAESLQVGELALKPLADTEYPLYSLLFQLMETPSLSSETCPRQQI